MNFLFPADSEILFTDYLAPVFIRLLSFWGTCHVKGSFLWHLFLALTEVLKVRGGDINVLAIC